MSKANGGRNPNYLQAVHHAAQNRIQTLLLDPLAVARPTSNRVSARNERLTTEMNAFVSFASGHAATYQDVCIFVDRITNRGVLPGATQQFFQLSFSDAGGAKLFHVFH